MKKNGYKELPFIKLGLDGLSKEVVDYTAEGISKREMIIVNNKMKSAGYGEEDWVVVSPSPSISHPNHIFIDTFFYIIKEWFSGSGSTYIPPTVLGSSDLVMSDIKDSYIVDNLKYFPYTDLQIEELKTSKKDFIFMSYNRRPTLLRIAFVNKLFESNLIKKGLVSFLATKKMVQNQLSLNYKKKLENLVGEYKLDFKFLNSIPLSVDMNYDATPLGIGENSNSENITYYNESYYHKNVYKIPFNNIKRCFFNVITETDFGSDSMKLSEKIYKGIGMSPIIVFSTPYSLKRLREHGFKTFPMLFDESYDDITDNTKRFNKIFSEIERVCNLPLEVLKEKYDEALEVVKHNQQVFLNAPSFEDVLKEKFNHLSEMGKML